MFVDLRNPGRPVNLHPSNVRSAEEVYFPDGTYYARVQTTDGESFLVEMIAGSLERELKLPPGTVVRAPLSP